MSRNTRKFAPAYWVRQAFLQDANEDSRIKGAAVSFLHKLVDSFSWSNGYAEASDSYVLRDVPISLRSCKAARKKLEELDRIEIQRKGGRRGDANLPTRYGINWYYRGSDRFRELNGGNHAVDFRDTRVTLPTDRHLAALPDNPNGQSGSTSQGANEFLPRCNPVPPKVQFLHPNLSSKEEEIGAPNGARPFAGAHGDASKDETKVPAGFAKWRIVHAEYVGKKGADEDEKDVLVAHLRSARGGKFTLRCHIDSDDYASLDDALDIDGEPEQLIGEHVMMSTNREGAKDFMRAAPKAWRDVTILAGETCEDGRAAIRVAFHDVDGAEATLTLSPEQAFALADECGGEARAIGARVRYRLMPDDTIEFRQLVAAERSAA